MNFHPLAIVTISALAYLCSGCASKRIEVGPGELQKLYAPSGLYIDLFVDPDEPNSSSSRISSDDYDDPQVMAYYDGVTLEKLMLAKGTEGMIIILDGEFHDAESYTFKTVSKTEGKKEVKEYELKLIETPKTNQDEPDASGQRR